MNQLLVMWCCWWYWQKNGNSNKQWVGRLFRLTELEWQSKLRISLGAHWCLPNAQYPMDIAHAGAWWPYSIQLPGAHILSKAIPQIFTSVLTSSYEYSHGLGATFPSSPQFLQDLTGSQVWFRFIDTAVTTAQKKTLASTCRNDLQENISKIDATQKVIIWLI